MHTILITLLLTLWATASPLVASVVTVAREGLEPLSSLLRRSGRVAAQEADALAQKVAATTGEKGVGLVHHAAASGLDAMEVSTHLLKAPQLAELGLDGLRLAKRVGPRAAVELNGLGREVFLVSVADPAQASRWLRAGRAIESLPPNERHEILGRFLKDPGKLDLFLRRLPVVGLGAALLAVGIGGGVALPVVATKAPEVVATTIGMPVLVAGMSLIVLLFVWSWLRWIRPLWPSQPASAIPCCKSAVASPPAGDCSNQSARRNPPGPLLILLALWYPAAAHAASVDFSVYLADIERGEREQLCRLISTTLIIDPVDSQRELKAEAGSLISTASQWADPANPGRTMQQIITERRASMGLVLAECVTLLRENQTEIRLNLPYELEQRIVWVDPVQPAAWDLADPSALLRALIRSDRLVRDGAIIVGSMKMGLLAGILTDVLVNELNATPIAAAAASAEKTASSQAIDQTRVRLESLVLQHLEDFHRLRRLAIADGLHIKEDPLTP